MVNLREAEVLLDSARELQFKQFTKQEKDDLEQKTLTLQGEVCNDSETWTQEKTILVYILLDIFQELNNCHQILVRQELKKKIIELKAKFFAVSQSDTCLTYITELKNEVEEFQLKLKSLSLGEHDLDLSDEVEDLVVRVNEARKNIKIQQGLEAFSGVTTLGCSAASGALGIASAVVRTGGTAAGAVAGTASGTAAIVPGVARGAGAATQMPGLAASFADDAIVIAGNAVNGLSSTTTVVKFLTKLKEIKCEPNLE